MSGTDAKICEQYGEIRFFRLRAMKHLYEYVSHHEATQGGMPNRKEEDRQNLRTVGMCWWPRTAEQI